MAAGCGASSNSSSSSTAAPAASSAPASDTTASSSDTTAASTDTSASSSDTSATSTGGGASNVKVGLATDQGGLNDKGFNQASYEGAKKASADFGVPLDVRESHSENDYIPNLTYFCQNGYNPVIAIGFLMAPAVAKVAKQCPDTQFAIVDNSVVGDPINKAKNITGLLFKEQETGYLVGYLSGLLLKEKPAGVIGTGGTAVSSVGGLKIPPVDRFIAGYQAGAKAADPGVKLINGYSQDFVDQSKCKNLALSQIGQGSSIVFQVAGACGLGVLDAAKAKNVWGIGVDKDQADVNDHVLTSAVKRVDQAVYLAIKAATEGQLSGGKDVVYGLAEDGVALGTVNKAVPQSIVDEVNKVADQIKAGSIDIPTAVK